MVRSVSRICGLLVRVEEHTSDNCLHCDREHLVVELQMVAEGRNGNHRRGKRLDED